MDALMTEAEPTTVYAEQAAGALWLVITPSCDDDLWRDAVREGAAAAGLTVVDATGDLQYVKDDPDVLILAGDVSCLVANNAGNAAIITPRPETAPDRVAELLGIAAPNDVHHASLLLAHALASSDRFRVVTAEDLAADAPAITLFDRLRIKPPRARQATVTRPEITAAMAIYAGLPKPSSRKIAWPEALFLYDPQGSRNANTTGEMDITGKARTLVYGPYLALPPGRWRATMRFAVDADAAKCHFRLDWGQSLDFAFEVVTPHQAGVYEMSLEHNWTDTVPSEFRILLLQGAFHGSLTFLGGMVECVTDVPTDT